VSALDRRLTRLEHAMDPEDEQPSLEERLRLALEEASMRRRLGLPAPERPEGDDPISQRLRQARIRADACRQQLRL
jgi:hypothetical protein